MDGEDSMPTYDVGKVDKRTLALGIDPRRATVRQRLQQQLVGLKEQQAQIEKALAALDKIPDVEVLLDLLRKVGV